MEPSKVKVPKGVDLNFKYLPAYAQYLFDNRLTDYSRALLKISRKIDLPLLRYFVGMTDDQLIAMGMERNGEMLKLFSQNKATEIIENSAKNWVVNSLPMIQRDQVIAEDIILVNFSRRKALRDLLHGYTQDVVLFGQIMEEVDRFTVVLDTILFNAFIHLQQEKINAINLSLKKRETELLEAQEIGQIGSFEWDLVGKNSLYTPQVYKIFEIEYTSSLQSFMDDVHPEDRESLTTAISKCLEGGVLDCEYRYVRSNKEKTLWCRGKVLLEDSKPVKMIGTIMDVTDRSRIIERLQQSEQLHQQAQALTHIGNWSWDVDQNSVKWSDEMYRIYGMEPQSEKITLERFLEFVHPEDKAKRMQEIQESLASLVVNEYVFKIIAANGSVKVLRGRGEVRIDKNKKPIALTGTCQDITKEFHLNQDLQEREVYLDQLLKNAPDAIIVIDEKSEIILWNPKTEAVFGWSYSEAIGKNLASMIIPVKYREAHKIGMQRLLKTGEAHLLNKTVEIEAINKKGEEFYVALTISQSQQSGRPIFIAFIRDITHERKIQTELSNKTSQLASLNKSLEQKNQELHRTNQELESFNFIASHDLQEPLRKIRIFSDRLLDVQKNNFDETSRSYLEKMHHAAGRMQKLIDDFLSFSKTISTPRNFEPTNLSALLDEIKIELAIPLEEKKAIIEATQLPVGEVIPFQFRQLMVNLISNSLKYSRQGVTPRIRITSSVVPGIQMKDQGASPDETYLAISFADNGIGFEQKYARKIFELFQRLHSMEKYSGTGIGLAICKKIVENHQGFITAHGVANVGATFTVYLPINQKP